ncbi:peptidase C14 [Fomitiporia mediterranea MF3/22]|uniref:peptidase C14 n=1 Tax=Fomitiporia mediterranea (strain MF3/22) TaxID=694068 RepID=UPI000440960D|nr:peptidase C14 [Fomitiporia mediterranea MF3/22]EJC99274.1 peptidase C14 [Fomitiporia mediterranea MF3/22]
MAPTLSVISKKKALLVAVRYQELHDKHPKEKPEFMLPGTHYDPPRVKKLLTDRYGYAERDIVILMDDNKHTRPTKEAMEKEMKDLVKDAQPGDHFVFSFSGHGSQIENLDGTEEDGYDEVIWPVDVEYDPAKPDYEKATNYIMDDTLKEILVDKLPPNAHLTVLLDCCHSGTGVDLPHSHSINSFDHMWVSPTVSPVSSPVTQSPYGLPVSGIIKTNLQRAMRQDSFPNISRSSTMESTGGESKRNMKGMARNMRMPYRIRGPDIKEKANGESILQDGVLNKNIDKRALPEQDPTKLAHAVYSFLISWSACLDGEIGLDSSTGGILTKIFVALLEENSDRTHKDMLEALTRELFQKAKDAKRWLRENGYGEIPQPKPSLGSLRPLDEILDEPFTF